MMPSFGTRSRANLEECHKDLQVLFVQVVERFDCSVIEGNRGQAEQNRAFHAGKSKLKYPESRHNLMPSMAADVVPYPIDWQDTARFCLFGGYVLGIAERLYLEKEISHRVRWGGDWSGDYDMTDQTFHDLPHFELIAVSRLAAGAADPDAIKQVLTAP